VVDSEVCAFGDNCPIHEVWCEAQAELVRKLRASTFDQLLNREKEIAK
jgi:DNA-binding IscR family transcriptional regulator